MCKHRCRFRVEKRSINSGLDRQVDLLGFVKVQMPEQCERSTWFRIRDAERERNLRIVESVVAEFGSWARAVRLPTVILFPELSVTEEAADFLSQKIATDSIDPNTLIVFGLEQLSPDAFLARIPGVRSCIATFRGLSR